MKPAIPTWTAEPPRYVSPLTTWTARLAEWKSPLHYNKATSAEQELSQEQAQFYKTLTADYATQFANQSNILKSIQSVFSPILAAGPSQKGFSAQQEAAMRTGTADTTAQAYKQASQAVNEKMGAQGGGNAYLPSGAAAQVNASLASSAAQANAAQQNQITTEDWAQGLANFQSATAALGGAAGLFNPTGYISGANEAGSSAFNSASTIQQQNSAWQGELGGALAGMGASFLGGFGTGLGKKAGGG